MEQMAPKQRREAGGGGPEPEPEPEVGNAGRF